MPDEPDAYSQQIAVDDAVAVLDAAGVEQAHVVGLSMGGFTALHLAQLFNDAVSSVFAAVEQGAWKPRDPRSLTPSTTGMAES